MEFQGRLYQTSGMARRRYLPLRGIRVLSFEVAFSLPAGTRTLAELGAEVVRVAGPARGGGPYIGVIDGVYLSKECIGINLKHKDGIAVARALVAEADVVCMNFTPRAMARLGLTPPDLMAIKPDLVVLQLSGYGTPGPWSEYPAFGPSTEAAGGLNAAMGNESDEPVRIGSGVFSDQLAGRFAALAVVAALERRRASGEGSVVDLSMTEAISTLLGGQVVRAAMEGRLPPRPGDRDETYAPQGVYPCAGIDEWVAITVKTDAVWAIFVQATGIELLTADRFATSAGRQGCHDEIDAIIRGWTAVRDKNDVARILQEAGVAAGPVRKEGDAFFDDHLRKNEAFQEIPHEQRVAGYGAHEYLRLPWTIEGRPRALLSDYRWTGADNARVLKRWLKIPASKVRKLEKDGALLHEAVRPLDGRAPVPGIPIDQDFALRLGLPLNREATG